jgi:seryl-tRNA(Sec) selenium transferase
MPPDHLTAALRQSKTPVIGRIKDNKVVFDLRSVRDAEVPSIVDAMANILAP